MTTCAKAIENFEAKSGTPAAEAKKVEIYCQIPMIKKLDPAAFAKLAVCEHLSLSTNTIDKMESFGQMPMLRILSIGRNQIKKIAKLEDVSATLQELWISYNQIKTLDELLPCQNLEVLYIGNNLISDWNEVGKLNALPNFRDILLVGNPIYEGLDETQCRISVLKQLPNIGKIDGKMVTASERAAAK